MTGIENDIAMKRLAEFLAQKRLASPSGDRRVEKLKRWWSVSSRILTNSATEREAVRVLHAFAQVLLEIPAKHFQRFINFGPQLVSSPHVDGGTWRFTVKVKPRQRYVNLRIIYLPPDFDDFTDERLVYAIAHEVAHIVDNPNPLEPREKAEDRADALLKEWGFIDPL